MAKNFTEPKSVQNGTTGISTGVKSSIPPTTGPTKLMKFPSMNMTNK
nr:MAG TPA: DNA gyrase subunit A [Caudoviricetes sp.]